jgi:predicted nucleotidyltransferase component of viral defense system
MTRLYTSADSLRRALLDRLRTQSLRSGLPINTLLTKVLMERLLARLFAQEDAPWLLKGGYAFELRYRPNARTTRDLDLSASRTEGDSKDLALEWIHAQLIQAAGRDLGDFMRFEVGHSSRELTMTPFGGATFPVTAYLGEKPLSQFHVDVALSEPPVGRDEQLTGADVLGFAGLPPAKIRAISTAQQFAEKLHAYSHPWQERQNTRVKDLVDMVMLVEREQIDPATLKLAVATVFRHRQRQPPPTQLVRPPEDWRDRYPELAAQARVRALDIDAAFQLVSDYWNNISH